MQPILEMLISQGFLVAEEVMTSNGYGIPNEPKYHYDLEVQYESDVYSQNEIYDIFHAFGINMRDQLTVILLIN